MLREELGLTGTKECCGSGECGACTILVDGESRLSCLMLAAQLTGRSVTTIEGVAAGECRIDPQLVDGLLVHRARPRAPLEALTPRQREILAVVAAGRSNLAIARHFGVTQRAVEKHVNEIFGRLGIANDESISRRVHATLLFLAEDDAP